MLAPLRASHAFAGEGLAVWLIQSRHSRRQNVSPYQGRSHKTSFHHQILLPYSIHGFPPCKSDLAFQWPSCKNDRSINYGVLADFNLRERRAKQSVDDLVDFQRTYCGLGSVAGIKWQMEKNL